jgi:hypothetical protein
MNAPSDDLASLKSAEHQARESADDSHDISERVGHLERARLLGERIAAIKAVPRA